MSRILFTTMPFAGHIRPGLPIARELVDARHEVLWYTGRKYAGLVAGSGATFVPYPEALEPDNLLRPAIAALADQDVLVIATSGGPDPDTVLAERDRPANVRIETFVPFTELLPLVDVVVTNGGYGGVQMALAYGVPLVGAGTTEDKMEVNARVAHSGAGVSLKVDRPTSAQLLSGVRTVLGDPAYRARARALQQAYARYGGARWAAEIVADTVRAVTGPVAGQTVR